MRVTIRFKGGDLPPKPKWQQPLDPSAVPLEGLGLVLDISLGIRSEGGTERGVLLSFTLGQKWGQDERQLGWKVPLPLPLGGEFGTLSLKLKEQGRFCEPILNPTRDSVPPAWPNSLVT